MAFSLSKRDIPTLADKSKKHPLFQKYEAPFPNAPGSSGKESPHLLTKHAGEYFAPKLKKL